MTQTARKLPHALLWAECLALSIGLPLGLWLTGYFRTVLYLTLWVIALTCVLVLRLDPSFDRARFFKKSAITKAELKKILLLFVPLAVALTLFTWYYDPGRFFGFPKERPQLWAMVMVLYPLLSVYPQEIIYRAFFFHRYAAILGQRHAMVWLSAAAFGFAHVMMNNWIAIVFSGLGGVIFGYRYVKNKSLALVSLEHALYGNFVFTVGLGWYFYHGAH